MMPPAPPYLRLVAANDAPPAGQSDREAPQAVLNLIDALRSLHRQAGALDLKESRFLIGLAIQSVADEMTANHTREFPDRPGVQPFSRHPT